jgi:hypothetical protein
LSRVEVEIEEVELENEDGRMQDGVRARCTRCDHETEAYGRTGKSRRRCLVLMREECPQNEENFYVDPDADEHDDRPRDPVPKKWWEK